MTRESLLVAFVVISQASLHALGARPDKEAVNASPEAVERDNIWNARAEAVEAVLKSLRGVEGPGALFEEHAQEGKHVFLHEAHDASQESNTRSQPGPAPTIPEEIATPTLTVDCAAVSGPAAVHAKCKATGTGPKAVLENIAACAEVIRQHIGCAKASHSASLTANTQYEMAFRRASSDLDALRNRDAAKAALAADQAQALTHLLSEVDKVQTNQIDHLITKGGKSVGGGGVSAGGGTD